MPRPIKQFFAFPMNKSLERFVCLCQIEGEVFLTRYIFIILLSMLPMLARPSILRLFSTAPQYRLFEIYRFNPARDIKPHMERYAVDLSQ